MAALHLTKVAFGCRDVEALARRVATRSADGELKVATRMRPKRAAELIGASGLDTVLIDCETGRFRLGLAAALARRLRADYRPIEQVAADDIVGVVRSRLPEQGVA